MNYGKDDYRLSATSPDSPYREKRLAADCLAWREIAEKLHGELVKEVGPGCGMKDCKNEYCQLLAAYEKAVQS